MGPDSTPNPNHQEQVDLMPTGRVSLGGFEALARETMWTLSS